MYKSLFWNALKTIFSQTKIFCENKITILQGCEEEIIMYKKVNHVYALKIIQTHFHRWLTYAQISQFLILFVPKFLFLNLLLIVLKPIFSNDGCFVDGGLLANIPLDSCIKNSNCKENEILVWNKENHKDKLVYLNGLTFIREFSEWFEGTGYNLWIGTKRGPKSYVEWRITEHSLGSELKITVYPFFFKKWPKFIAFLPYYLYINPKLTSYLNSVVGGFKWYLDKGTAVPRNHFGKHRWFS